jgi:hypothetical protein
LTRLGRSIRGFLMRLVDCGRKGRFNDLLI